MASASSLFSVALSYAFPTSATKSFTVPHKNLKGGGGWGAWRWRLTWLTQRVKLLIRLTSFRLCESLCSYWRLHTHTLVLLPPTCLSATSPPHSHYLLTAVTLPLHDSAGRPLQILTVLVVLFSKYWMLKNDRLSPSTETRSLCPPVLPRLFILLLY